MWLVYSSLNEFAISRSGPPPQTTILAPRLSTARKYDIQNATLVDLLVGTVYNAGADPGIWLGWGRPDSKMRPWGGGKSTFSHNSLENNKPPGHNSRETGVGAQQAERNPDMSTFKTSVP